MPRRVPSELGWDRGHQLSGSHSELSLDPKTHLFWFRYLPNPALLFFILLLGKDTQAPQLTGNAAYKYFQSKQPRYLCSWTGKLRPELDLSDPVLHQWDALSLRHIQTKLSTVFMKACQVVSSLNFQTTKQELLSFWDGCEESALRSQPWGNWWILLVKWWCSQKWQTGVPGGHAPSRTPRVCNMLKKMCHSHSACDEV